MTSTYKPSKTWNLFLWAAQIFLSAGFIWAAAMKLFQPADKLAAMWPWTADNAALVKITGLLDLLASLGLILPMLFRKWYRLIIYTAFGSILLMISASIFHIIRNETSQIGVNIAFAAIAVFIALGRKNIART